MYLQAGVPEIDRLEYYRPTLAVLAPGFPEPTLELPFDVPNGLGVVVYEPQTTPTEFYEPFTQTSSWVWIEDTLTLNETGEGYIVGWNNEEKTGKMWVATGVVEDFSDVEVTDFIVWNEYVNNFHETGTFETVLPKEEEECITMEENGETSDQNKGCEGSKSAFILIPLLLFGRRNF